MHMYACGDGGYTVSHVLVLASKCVFSWIDGMSLIPICVHDLYKSLKEQQEQTDLVHSVCLCLSEKVDIAEDTDNLASQEIIIKEMTQQYTMLCWQEVEDTN